MMTWLTTSSLRYRRIVLAAAAAVMALGVWQLPQAQVDSLSEFAPVTVQVQTEALGLSAQEVESLITVPLEQDLLNGVAFLKHIHSASVPGLSNIDMVFEPGTDPLKARQVVQERMTQAHALPNVSQPPQMMQPVSSSGRVAMIGLTSKTLTPIEMGVLSRWTIRPKLIGIPGVANVAIWGQRERQLQVQVDPTKLKTVGVTLDEVIATTGNALLVSPLSFLEASTPGTGGFIDTPNQRLGVQHMVPLHTAEELANVVVEDDRDRRLRLGDVATVVEGNQPLIGDASVTGGNGFLLVVEKLPGANTIEVTRAVEDALATLAPGLKGLEMDTSVFRPASYVEQAVRNVGTMAIVGGLLMLLALGAFLFNWRRAVIGVVAITLSLVTAALVLHLLGTTVNALVLAGLVMALVAVVDDATAAADALSRRLPRTGHGLDRTEGGRSGAYARLVRDVALGSGRVIAYSTAIIVVALLPVFLLDGLAGEFFFPPLAIAALAALLASFLVSVTVTPALCLALLHNAPPESPVVRWTRRVHARALKPFLRRPLPVVGVVALGLVALGGLVLPAQMEQSLLPSLREPQILIRWDGAAGTALPEMNRIGTRVSNELRGVPGVDKVGAHFGRAVTSDQAVGANGGMIWVSVDPSADYDRTVGTIQEVVDGYPGLDRQLVTYSDEQVRRVTSGASDPVVVRVYGEDLTVLRKKADEIRGLVSKIDGVGDHQVTPQVEEPTVQIEVDLAKARVHGVKPGDVRRSATTLLSGIQVGSLFDNQKVFDVQVWSPLAVRRNVTDIGDLLIDAPGGKHVRLADVATVRIAASPNTIAHDGVSRRIDVTADVSGRSLDAVLADVRTALGDVQFPLEYHAEVLGDFPAQQATQRRLMIFAAVAALGIFLLLQSAFGSWRLAVVTFCTLPLALLGGFVASWLDGGGLTLASVAGLGAVLAFAVRAGISLVQRLQQLGRDEGESFGPALVNHATQERVGPVLTTVFTAGLALVPLLVVGSMTGLEILRPMAAVILGGLVTTTLVTLFVLPALYLRFSSRPAPDEPSTQTAIPPVEVGSSHA